MLQKLEPFLIIRIQIRLQHLLRRQHRHHHRLQYRLRHLHRYQPMEEPQYQHLLQVRILRRPTPHRILVRLNRRLVQQPPLNLPLEISLKQLPQVLLVP